MKKLISYTLLSNYVSENRLERYVLETGGDTDKAALLYPENLIVSKELYDFLHWLEVGMRNAMNKALIGRYGHDWLDKPNELRLQPYVVDKIDATKRQLADEGKTADNPRVVAAMSFAFWVSLLDGKHDELWRRCLANGFPHRPRDLRRTTIHGMVNQARKLRNRVAHYEPILHLKPEKQIQDMLTVIGWINPQVAAAFK